MKAAGQYAAADGSAEVAHPRLRRRPPWWLAVALVPALAIVVVCVRDAASWVGRPFAGFLFLDSRIVVSIGRSAWRLPSLRRAEWAHITAVDGRPVGSAVDVHAAARDADVGHEITYGFRRGAEVFRLAIPVRRFGWADFAEIFAPMLGVGAWLIAIGAAFVVLRPDLPEIRALFAACLMLGLALVTGPDQYGPYRFTWLFLVSLAAVPTTFLHMTAAFLWKLRPWAGRVVAAMYVAFIGLGAALVVHRDEPAVFLPLLYLVYFALANALLLYTGSLVSVLVSGQRSRPHVTLALAGILASSIIAIGIIVTYPLRTEPVSAPWFILPMAVWPVLSGLAFIRNPDAGVEPGAPA